MPKKVYRIRKFEGGLNEVSDPKDLEEGQFSDVQDVSFDKLGQARNIGAGTLDTDVKVTLPGNAITEARGLHGFSSSYTYQPASELAMLFVDDTTNVDSGTKAFGSISVVRGYIDMMIPKAGTPQFTIFWQSTTGGHAAVTISDSITGWYHQDYIAGGGFDIGDYIAGSIKTDSVEALVHTKVNSETSTPNFVSTEEGVQLKLTYDTAVGSQHDYDSDGSAENTAGALIIGGTNVSITLGNALSQSQINLISETIHQEEQFDLYSLNADYIFVEVDKGANPGEGHPGWLLLHKTDIAGGASDAYHTVELTVGTSTSQLTWITGTTTIYSFTIYDETSNTSDTTSLTTTGTSNDTAAEVAAALRADYNAAVHQNIASSVTNNVITFTNAGADEPFTVTTSFVHNQGNTAVGEDYLLYAGPDRKLSTFSYDRENDGAQKAWNIYGTIAWTDAGNGTGWATDTPNPHIYDADGSVRIVDKDFSANLVNAWYGYVGPNTSRWAGNSILNGWATYAQALKFDGNYIRTRADTAVGTIGSDNLVHINLTAGADGTGFWNDSYRFRIAAVFSDGQESFPSKLLSHHADGRNYLAFGAEAMAALVINIGVRPHATEPFENGRIVGFSIYFTKLAIDSTTWFHLGTIDETNGWKGADGQISALSDSSAQANIAQVTVLTDDVPSTYESRGFPSLLNDTIHAFNGTDGLKYKTSCIAKNRLFVGNISYGTVTRGSEMCVTPWRKFDTFPVPYGIITVNNDDGDDIVHLESSGDRILQFKHRHLYVVNVLEIGNEFVEAKHNFKGVAKDYHVTKVLDGIAFINNNGVYLYNESNGQIDNLFYPIGKKSGKRVESSTWTAFFSKNTIIGYDSIRNQLLIKKSTAGNSTSGNMYLYDFTVDAWSFGFKRFSNNKEITNFVTTPNGHMTALKKGNPGDIFENGGEVPV